MKNPASPHMRISCHTCGTTVVICFTKAKSSVASQKVTTISEHEMARVGLPGSSVIARGVGGIAIASGPGKDFVAENMVQDGQPDGHDGITNLFA